MVWMIILILSICVGVGQSKLFLGFFFDYYLDCFDCLFFFVFCIVGGIIVCFYRMVFVLELGLVDYIILISLLVFQLNGKINEFLVLVGGAGKFIVRSLS